MSGDFSSSSSPQRNSAEDIKQIVSYLKQPPFNRNDTLVSFSQLSPLELLQLVNDVFASLDEKQRRDLRDEPSDITTHRMIDFLITTLAYRPPALAASSAPNPEQLADFGSSFISAAPATVHPVLLYLLANYAALTTRAYLAQYLSVPSLPADIAADPTVSSLLAVYAQRQDEFRAVHRQTEEVKVGGLDAAGLKREVNQLESEREQLRSKLKRLMQKVEMEAEEQKGSGGGSGGFAEMLRFTNLLRLEQEEEQKLQQQREEQKARLDDLKQDVQRVSRQYDDMCKYHSVQAAPGQPAAVNPQQLLSRLRAEVKEEEEEVERTLELELLEAERTLKHLQRATDALGLQSYSEEDVEELKAKQADLERQVKAAEEEKERMVGGSESQLGFLYDRLSAVQRKRDKLQLKLEESQQEVEEARLEKEKTEAELELLSRQRGEEELDGIPRGGAELKRYMEALAVRTLEYKQLKAQLEAQQAETAVLQSTFTTLSSRVTNQEELNAQLEKQRGVEGWRQQEDRLVDAAVRGRQLDEQKAQSLEQISALVERIEQEIRGKKNALAPSIKELRQARAEYEREEADFKQGKAADDKVRLRYESERLKLEGEVAELSRDVVKEQRRQGKARLETRILSVKQETLEPAAGRKQYVDGMAAAIKELQKREKQLKKEKKSMNDNGNAYVNQRQLFTALESVLKVQEERA